MPISFTLERTIQADPDTVFSVLTDHRGLQRITPLRKATLDREGSPEPDGVGAVRRLVAVGPALVEEVTVFERPSRFAYRMLSGLPVRDHTGDVALAAAGTATQMRYRVDSTPTVAVPGAGKALEGLLRAMIGGMLRGVAKEAERRAR
jgi:uncharacterized protein YndB with AHSA1/START domain